MLPIGCRSLACSLSLSLSLSDFFEGSDRLICFGASAVCAGRAHDVISVEWLLKSAEKNVRKKCKSQATIVDVPPAVVVVGALLLLLLTKPSVFVLTTNTEYKLRNALKRNNQFTS